MGLPECVVSSPDTPAASKLFFPLPFAVAQITFEVVERYRVSRTRATCDSYYFWKALETIMLEQFMAPDSFMNQCQGRRLSKANHDRPSLGCSLEELSRTSSLILRTYGPWQYVLKVKDYNDPANAAKVSYIMQIWHGVALILAQLLLFCANFREWAKNRINYAFNFEFTSNYKIN
ncbi:Xenotropic and polytropic retrovirus receptor 1 [Rhizina undulata]